MGQKSRSKKGPAIEYLYEKVFLGEGRSVVTLREVGEAIEHCNKTHGLSLSSENTANFMKDLVRGKNAERNWPQKLKDARIGGRQRVGQGRVFEFVPYAVGQTDPFESSFKQSEGLSPVPVQSLSMPLTARSLGRTDESWLIQVAVGLRLIETHFVIRKRTSSLKVIEIVHLQTGVKLSSSEIDALFLAVIEKVDGEQAHALITCEAKQSNERILEHQIVEQIVAANKSVKSAGLPITFIIPIAIQARTDPEGCVYLAEFEQWTPEQAEEEEDKLGNLHLVAEGLYQLRPPVPGIGTKRRRSKN